MVSAQSVLGFELIIVCKVTSVCIGCFKMELHINCGFLNDVVEIDTWKITRMKLNISPAVIRDSEYV